MLTPALRTVVTVLAAIPITALTAVVWLVVLRRFIPFYRDKNLTSALRTFFFAGFLSIPIIVVFSVTIAPIGYARTFSAVTELWNMIVIVGILEEFSKWVVFAVVMQRLRPLRSPEDGILLAAAVGLAFASVENVLKGADGSPAGRCPWRERRSSRWRSSTACTTAPSISG